MEKTLLALFGGAIFGGAAMFGFSTLTSDEVRDESIASKESSVEEKVEEAKDSGVKAKKPAKRVSKDSSGELKNLRNQLEAKNSEIGKLRALLAKSAKAPASEVKLAGAETKAAPAEALKVDDPVVRRKSQETYATMLDLLASNQALGAPVEGEDEATTKARQESGRKIRDMMLELRNMGPAAYPSLFAAYSKIFSDADGNAVTWEERQRIQERLSIPSLRGFISGELYTTIMSDRSGTVPEGMVASAMWTMQRDPAKTREERTANTMAMLEAYPGSTNVEQTALWSLQRGSEERTNLAFSLMNAETSSPETRSSAIDSLPNKLDEKMVAQLRNMESDGNKSVVESARYALQRHNPVATGYLVSGVTGGSSAASAGLRKGDIIVSINGTEMNQAQSIRNVKNTFKAGEKVTIMINRGGQLIPQEISTNAQKTFGVDGGNVKQGETQQPRGRRR